MEEIWKPVPYEPFDKVYSVSNLGRVKPNAVSRYSKNKAEFLAPAASPRGYLHVSLYAEGKSRCAFVHRMVTIAFHGPPPFPGAMACHEDDCQTNNRADNLAWGNEHKNWRDRVRNGRDEAGERNGRAKLTENDVRLIRALYAEDGVSQQVLADRFGIHQTKISAIIRRKLWPHVT